MLATCATAQTDSDTSAMGSNPNVVQSFDEDNVAMWDYWLNFSWSSTAMQDTLVVNESMWTNCYLWGNFPPAYNDFMGFWGNLIQTNGIQAHRFRFLLSEDGVDFELDPEAAIQFVTYDELECYFVLGEKALFEFDVYIDVSLFDTSGATTNGIGLLPSNASPVPPEAVFRLSDECGLLSISIETDVGLISAHSDAVPNEGTSFGRIKASYR